MGSLVRRFGAQRWLRVASVVGAVFFAATCSDQPPVTPKLLAPGHARFSLRAAFQAIPAGGPAVVDSTIRGILIGPNGETYSALAVFHGDTARLEWDVPLAGGSTDFTLELTAFDGQGNETHHSSGPVTLRAGDNDVPQQQLVYSGRDAKLQILHVSPTSMQLNAGGSGSLNVSGTDSSGAAVLGLRIGWTSRNGAIATVDDNGGVSAGSLQGSTYIVARSATNIADSALVRVRAPVDHIVVSPTSLTLARGLSGSVSAQLRDVGNNVIDDRTASFSTSDATVATVSAAGAIQAVGVGSATITASAEGKSTPVAVTVISPIDHVELTPASLTFASLGESQAVTGKVVPVTGASVAGIAITYASSNAAIATVDGSGNVTARGNGSATITATAETKSATTGVTVQQVAATVAISPSAAGVSFLGDSRTFTAAAADARGNPISGGLTWSSSNASVVSVVNGVAVGRARGSATITAAFGDKSATASFTVSQIPAGAFVTVDKNPMRQGTNQQVKIVVTDAGGSAIPDATAQFTSDNTAVISVNAGGLATAVAVGQATITAAVGTFAPTVTITVIPATGIVPLAVSPSSATKAPNATQQFTVTAGAPGPYVWSVNDVDGGNATFGTVTSDGLYTAPAAVPSPSTFDVCARRSAAPTDKACAHVTIAGGPLTISPATAEKLPGGTQQFTVTAGGAAPYVWAVNGVDGGNATFGTITTAGLYSAPAAVPSPASFDVCARRSASPPEQGCAHVTINPIPTSGADVIVFNDINVFDSPGDGDANNQTMFRNLVNFTGTGPRVTKTGVMFFFGHNSNGAFGYATMRSVIAGAGFTIDNVTADLNAPIDPKYKVVFLWLPRTTLSTTEINNLKQFSAEGGRIVFVGEWDGFYGVGISVENAFFSAMGAQMTNSGGAFDCGFAIEPASRLRPHQVTTGVNQVTVACASQIIPGPNDYAFMFDQSGTRVLAAAAKVDVTPIAVGTSVHAGVPAGKRSPAKPAAIGDGVARDPKDPAGRPITP